MIKIDIDRTIDDVIEMAEQIDLAANCLQQTDDETDDLCGLTYGLLAMLWEVRVSLDIAALREVPAGVTHTASPPNRYS